jgi:hypothetical protein
MRRGSTHLFVALDTLDVFGLDTAADKQAMLNL